MTTTQPNILLILTDDMGYSDIGCFGGEIDTPNLDRLAGEGVRMTQFYNCAKCCPSRASLLTGLYPHQAGVGAMVDTKGHEGNPAYQGYLRDDARTFGEVLKTAGYQTLYSGKWHTGGGWARENPEQTAQWTFGEKERPTPFDRGFDRFYGTPVGASSYFNIQLVEDNQCIPLPKDFYTTDSYTTRAIDYMNDACDAGKPWFMHVCYNAPHWPLHAHPEDIEKYRGKYREGWDVLRVRRHEKLKAMGILSPEWAISARDEQSVPWDSLSPEEQEWQDIRMAVYAAQVECVDRNVGRMIDALEAKGELDNTIIIFLSDNGGCPVEVKPGHNRDFMFTRDGRPMQFGSDPTVEPGPENTFQAYGLSWANLSNTPFRYFKHYIHEGGISTPCIIRYPNEIAANSLNHQMVHFLDVAPTLYDWAGADYEVSASDGIPAQPLEGTSFRGCLQGGELPENRKLFWEHFGNCAVREGHYKAVKKLGQPWELYDMKRDRTELMNLSKSDPDRLIRLVSAYEAWAEKCGVE